MLWNVDRRLFLLAFLLLLFPASRAPAYSPASSPMYGPYLPGRWVVDWQIFRPYAYAPNPGISQFQPPKTRPRSDALVKELCHLGEKTTKHLINQLTKLSNRYDEVMRSLAEEERIAFEKRAASSQSASNNSSSPVGIVRRTFVSSPQIMSLDPTTHKSLKSSVLLSETFEKTLAQSTKRPSSSRAYAWILVAVVTLFGALPIYRFMMVETWLSLVMFSSTPILRRRSNYATAS